MSKILNIFLILFLLFTFSCYVNADNDSIVTTTDEFKSVEGNPEFNANATTDEFAPLDTASTVACSATCTETPGQAKNFSWAIGILLITVLAGILVRFRQTRNLRTVFLVASLAILGFYKGACPCPIQSLQNTAFYIMGLDVKWQSLVYIAGLIPITYLFGRVFCGWICHLGALQEFIFGSSRLKLLQNAKAQKIMRIIRIVALTALIVQVIITQTNLYKKIDPFAIIFNFHSISITGYVIAGILVISSIFIYRPFCKTLCPIGIILGWISKIPGASVLGTNSTCTSCSICSNNCKIRAITHDNKISILENQECIRCGDCLDGCKKNSITFYFKGKKHDEKTECTGITAY
jgi:polyferredoxin